MHLNRIKLSCKRGSRPDAADRVTQLKYTKSDGNVIDQIDYTYDAAGQRISKTMLNGNSVPETPMTATFDAGNRMQTITLNPGKPEQKIYTLTYDNNGNLTKKQLSTDANCTIDCTDYVWDSRNRLVQIKQNQTTSATYSYDAENRRIQTNITTNGQTNQVSYIYAGSQSVGEVRNQQLSHSLMTGLQMDEHIARIALNQGATPQVKTYLTDALGSVIATAKADQSLEVGYAFSPYGQTQKVGVENQQPGSENSSQYTGRENDNNGLYFYRARYYDPVLKRFISEDPIGLAGGINSHTYVEGDPVGENDPTGLATYMCTQPLHGLGKMGKPVYSPSSNKLFHQFIGIIGPDGKVTTGGQDRASALPWGDGKPSEGDGAPGSGAECKKVADDNQCLESCLMPKLTSSERPKYALLPGTLNGGENCQSWADKTYAECFNQCKSK